MACSIYADTGMYVLEADPEVVRPETAEELREDKEQQQREGGGKGPAWSTRRATLVLIR